MGTEIRAEQRQAILAILVSLVACVAVSSDNLIFGHLTGLRLERPPTVRRWQALVVLCVTALSAWGLVLPHAKPLVRRVAAFAPESYTRRIAFRTVARTAARVQRRAGKIGCEGGKNSNE